MKEGVYSHSEIPSLQGLSRINTNQSIPGHFIENEQPIEKKNLQATAEKGPTLSTGTSPPTLLHSCGHEAEPCDVDGCCDAIMGQGVVEASLMMTQDSFDSFELYLLSILLTCYSLSHPYYDHGQRLLFPHSGPDIFLFSLLLPRSEGA